MRKILKPALAMLSLAILGACSDRDLPVDDNTGHVADKSEVRYLRVAICNPGSGGSGTKAPDLNDDNLGDDYVAGQGIENDIKTVDFYFYDDHKLYLSHTNLKAANYPNPDRPTTDFSDPSLDLESTPGDNVEAIYHCNVPVTLVQGERLPAYVLCIVNAVNPNAHEDVSMADAQQQLLYSLYDLDDKTYFGMNNSVYYGTDQVTGKENQLIMATPFDATLLKSASELEEAAKANEARLNIYVERYAAKVTLQLAEDAIQDFQTGNNNVTLKFNPVKWGLNAYEKSYYLIKGYRMQNDPTQFAPFENVEAILFPGWNRPEHFRSFWARTPAYYDNNYPVVTDDILDVITGTYNPNFDPGNTIQGYPYLVYYSSYNSVQGEVGKAQYVMETTLKQQRLNGTDMPPQYLPINSIPSVVLTGKYTVNVNGTDYTDKTFYTYSQTNGKPDVYAANKGELGSVQTLKDKLIDLQNILLVKRDNGEYTSFGLADLGDDANMFVIDHPDKAVRNDGSMKIPGDIVTLQLKALNGKELYYFSSKANSQQYVKIQESDFTEVNRLLYQNLGGAHMFLQGKAFFTAPIQHWGWYRTTNQANKVTGSDGKVTYSGGNNGRPMSEWDWSQMLAGDFGIVRNHVYTVNVGKIAGLGTGIRNDDHPLLPSADKIGYNIHFDIHIQKWALLPPQQWEW